MWHSWVSMKDSNGEMLGGVKICNAVLPNTKLGKQKNCNPFVQTKEHKKYGIVLLSTLDCDCMCAFYLCSLSSIFGAKRMIK